MNYRKYIEIIKKNKNLIYLIVLVFVEIFDLILLIAFSNRKLYNVSKSLLDRFQFNSLNFKPTIYQDSITFTSYLLAFVFGGILAFSVVKIIGKIATGTKLVNYEMLTLVPLSLFILIFIIGCLVSKWNPLWLCPLLSYIGGLLLYFLSHIKLKVNL